LNWNQTLDSILELKLEPKTNPGFFENIFGGKKKRKKVENSRGC
jgi:hypothetical protein